MLEDADSPENMTNDLGLAREVGRVAEDHLGLGLELHLLDTSHGGLDANSLAALLKNLVNVGVEHVSAAIDGREAGKTLGQLAKTVERVDVRRFSVTGDGVAVEADTLDGLRGLADGGHVLVGQVEGHGVADEVAGASLKTELVIDLLHAAVVDIKTYVWLLAYTITIIRGRQGS